VVADTLSFERNRFRYLGLGCFSLVLIPAGPILERPRSFDREFRTLSLCSFLIFSPNPLVSFLMTSPYRNMPPPETFSGRQWNNKTQSLSLNPRIASDLRIRETRPCLGGPPVASNMRSEKSEGLPLVPLIAATEDLGCPSPKIKGT